MRTRNGQFHSVGDNVAVIYETVSTYLGLEKMTPDMQSGMFGEPLYIGSNFIVKPIPSWICVDITPYPGVCELVISDISLALESKEHMMLLINKKKDLAFLNTEKRRIAREIESVQEDIEKLITNLGE